MPRGNCRDAPVRRGTVGERFRFQSMASPLTLTILGGSLFAATAIGVHLGESSVGLINPIHFQGPALHPRERGVAIDESNLRQPVRTSYRDLYGWDEGRAAQALTDAWEAITEQAGRDAQLEAYRSTIGAK